MYGFIYITTNHINNKKYIGQKKYDKNNNWKTYLGSGIILTRAIDKYGRENFSKEIIEECESKRQLNEREKYWIAYYNAVDSDEFYNIASGGDGGRTCYGSTHHASKKVYQYDKDGNFIKEWDNAQRASESLNICVSDIHIVCRGNKGVQQAGNFMWSYIKVDKKEKYVHGGITKKKILQLNTSFDIVKSYKNISYVDDTIYNKEKVTNCCKFRAISHNGYYWIYANDYSENTINKIIQMKSKKPKDVLSKKVFQIDDCKRIINTYKNSLEASEKTGIKRGTIQAYCKRGVANHGLDTTGYYWTYDVS